jgi:multisubunit Na+/H+ antiporter MnhC subunit
VKRLIDPKIVIGAIFVLYGVGMYCLITKKDMIRLLIGLTILMNAANLSFILFSTVKVSGLVDPLPHSLVVLAIVIDGCVIAVGLTLIILIHRKYESLNIDWVRRLKW